ncbi:hypothetical protein BMF89_16765 [Arthrobacter sp. SRS-W-1-2016]|uniref:hypothetical protein n=1 Tax=Arthrobacter sp. SRS-W-1-2016 TaxID=1930254 RepID=UPI000991414D|nr:hypothetical protein [Arthrobacter sp. SRS-W-1-2016]OOP60388.1 hypothetical protein BMF89_16765 [Arthrobacter sp. SRS-W-1-2016]
MAESDGPSNNSRQTKLALIAATTALVSAIVGPTVAIAATHWQTDATSTQAQTEFIHSNRQQAYSKYAADIEQLYSILWEHLGAAQAGFPHKSSDDSYLIKLQTETAPAVRGVFQDEATIRLVGSNELRLETVILHRSVINMFNNFSCGVEGRNCESTQVLDFNHVSSNLQDDVKSLEAEIDTWSSKARVDLGTE